MEEALVASATNDENLVTENTLEEMQEIPVDEAIKKAEKAAINAQKKINLQAAPVRQYLEGSVVPVLMQGLQALCKERPDNPVEYLAYYLLAHNPQNPKPAVVLP